MARAPGRELLFHEILAKKSTAGFISTMVSKNSGSSWHQRVVFDTYMPDCPVSCKSFMWSDSLLCIV